jgi:pimeloyl-ACP methyl ester carboxylesterase
MDRTDHHATALDGTRIGWSSAGTGKPAVVLTDGIGCAGYIWRPLEAELARERRVVHWTYRGHGASGAPADPERMTVDDTVSDLVSVLDSARERRAVLVGHSMGVQIVLEAYRRKPERVKALVLLFGAAGRLLDTFHDTEVARQIFPFAREAVLRWPDVARRVFRSVIPTELSLQYALRFEVDRERVPRSDLERYLSDLAAVDPALFVRLLDSAAAHDASPVLPHVRVPTLVVAGERDTFTPLHLSVQMARTIPGAELLVVPGATHVGPLEHPALVNEGIRRFLERHAPVRPRRGRVDGVPKAAVARAPRAPRVRKAAAAAVPAATPSPAPPAAPAPRPRRRPATRPR